MYQVKPIMGPSGSGLCCFTKIGGNLSPVWVRSNLCHCSIVTGSRILPDEYLHAKPNNGFGRVILSFVNKFVTCGLTERIINTGIEVG